MDAPNAATADAVAIKEYAGKRAKAYATAGGERYAFESGTLAAYVVMLCAERDRLQREMRELRDKLNGRNARAQMRDVHVTEVYMGESPLWVAYEYTPHEGAAYERFNASAAIVDVYVNGAWCGDPESYFNRSTLERWEDAIAERRHQEEVEAPQIAAERAWEARRDDQLTGDAP